MSRCSFRGFGVPANSDDTNRPSAGNSIDAVHPRKRISVRVDPNKQRTLSVAVRNSMAAGKHSSLEAEFDPEIFGDLTDPNLGVTLWFKNLFVSPEFESLSGVVIVLNLVFIVWETDIRSTLAFGEELSAAAVSRGLQQMNIVEVVNLAFLVFYVLECVCRFWALRGEFFLSGWNGLDMFLVTTGVTGQILGYILDSKHTSLLRTIRMVRLLRLSRTFIAFRELYRLICGLTHCMQTLFWASGLIFLTLTVWSIFAVEFIHPLMPAIVDTGTYDLCTWCPHAFSSVMSSNLTFFQIMSGDGWSSLTRPIIEKHWWTALIFVTVIFVVLFGLLNLIIAAIVDSAAQARERDIEFLSHDANAAREEAWTVFRNLCIELDTDNSGGIGLDELRNGLKTNETLRNYFSVMDVEEDDLTEMFKLLDEDNSGDLSYKEFHNQLYKMKTLEVKTTLYYVVRYVSVINKQIMKQEALLKTVLGMDPSQSMSIPLCRKQAAEVPDGAFSDVASGSEPCEEHSRQRTPEEQWRRCQKAMCFATSPCTAADKADGTPGEPAAGVDAMCPTTEEAAEGSTASGLGTWIPLGEDPSKIFLDLRPTSFTKLLHQHDDTPLAFKRVETPVRTFEPEPSNGSTACVNITEKGDDPWVIELPPASASAESIRRCYTSSADDECLKERETIWTMQGGVSGGDVAKAARTTKARIPQGEFSVIPGPSRLSSPCLQSL